MKLQNLNKKYKQKVIYDQMDIDLSNNGIHVLYGESGSGKSTLINILLGVDKNVEGQYIVDNVELTPDQIDNFRQQNIGYMAQSNGIIEQFTVYQNIKLYDQNIADEKIEEILKLLEIDNLINELGKSLSGGQRQRVRLARSLIRDKKIIIMDEPTNNLDDKNVQVILNILSKLSVDKTLVIATHDARVISKANFVHEIKNNKIETKVNDGNTSKVEYTENTETNFKEFEYALQTMKSLFSVKFIPIVLMLFGVLGLSFFLSGLNKEKALYEDHLLNLQPGIIFVTENSRLNSEGVYVGDSESLMSVEQVADLETLEAVDDVYIRSTVLTESKNLQKYIVNADKVITDEKLEMYFTKVENIDSSKYNSVENQVYYYLYEALPYDMFSAGITSLEESYVEIVEGDYPQDNTNQVLVPLSLANTEEAISVGNEVTYNSQTYEVSGIYDDLKYIELATENTLTFESYSSKVQNKIYYAFTDKQVPTAKQLDNYYKQNQSSFTNSGINSLEQFKTAYQDGITEVIVDYDQDQDESVYSQIEELGLEQDSRYTMYLDHQGDFTQIRNKKIISMVVLFVVFLVFFGLIYKYRFAFRLEEFNILFDNGLLPSQIIKLLTLESIMDTIIVGVGLSLSLVIGNLIAPIVGLGGLMVTISDVVVTVVFVLVSLILINVLNFKFSLKKRGK